MTDPIPVKMTKRWHFVDISAVSHDPASNELTVVFANGGSYIYSGISSDHYAALMAAPSIGSHLHKVIKPAAKTVRKA